MDEQGESSANRAWVLRGLALLAIVGVVAVAALWWQAPNASWACSDTDATSGCTAEVTLDVEALGLQDPFVGFNGFDVSPTGDEVVLVVSGKTDNDRVTDNRVVVAVFDSATGELDRVLVDRTSTINDGAGADQVAYSADGSSVVASVFVDGRSSVELLNAATGQTITTVIESTQGSISCGGRFGLSPDASQLQCGTGLWSTTTPGEPVETLSNEARFAGTSGSLFAWSTAGIVADRDLAKLITIRPEAGDEVLLSINRVDTQIRDSSDNYLTFHPSGGQLLEIVSSEPWSFLSLNRRSTSPGADYVLYNIADGSVANQFAVAEPHYETAWNEAGQLATLSRSNTLRIYDLS